MAVYDPIKRTIRPCNSGGRDKKGYLWNDLNDDGLATDDEVQQIQRNKLGGYLNPKDFALLTTPYASDYQPGHLLRPTRFTSGGTPVYMWNEAAKIPPWRENGQEFHPLDFRQSEDGSWFGCFADGARNPNEGAESHGAWYYNSCSAIDRVVKWDKDWKQLLSVGRHSPDNDHETGSSAMARGFVGLAHGCIIQGDASDEEICRPVVWTEDGLYVDELLRVPLDNLPKVKYGEDNTNEYPLGHVYTDSRTGETLYFALNSGGGAPIYRITGWGELQRSSGSVELKAEARQFAKRNGSGIKGEYFNNGDCTGTPALTRIDPLIYFNWVKTPPDSTINGEQFSVRWTGSYEAATNEATRFEIRGSFPWRDKGRPQWAKLWLGGQLIFDSKAGLGNFDGSFNQDGSTVGNVRVKVRAGEKLNLRLECGFKKGSAAIALNHDTPSLDRRAILPPFLYREAGNDRTLEIATDPRPAVIADFGFEEPNGVILRSRSGGDIFGRLTGNSKRTQGVVGAGVELEGKGDFDPASFPIDEELRLPDSNYTIALWFKTGSANVRICEARRYTSYNNRWGDHLISVEGGKLRFGLQGDAPLYSKQVVNDSMWHHIVTVVGEGGQRLYIDGKLAGQGKLAFRKMVSNRLGLTLGPGEQQGSVAIDELKVLSTAIDAERVNKLFTKK